MVAPKKKKKTAKSSRTATGDLVGASIEAEDTLAMIKNALKSGGSKLAKELESLDAADGDG